MALKAVVDGEVRWADEVPESATPTCRVCGDEMHVRGSHTTTAGVFKPRCFVHNPTIPEEEPCPGGESDTHRLMKYVASHALEFRFDEATVTREQKVPGTDRTGDVVVQFDGLRAGLGRGVVAEIQYRNTGKAIEAVTAEYLEAGYSVYWIHQSDFGAGFERLELPDPRTVGPLGVPPESDWEDGYEDEEHGVDSPPSAPIHVVLPAEWWQQTLTEGWRMGRLQRADEIRTVILLRENNATRRCEECGGPADVLVGTSMFRCWTHLPVVEQ